MNEAQKANQSLRDSTRPLDDAGVTLHVATQILRDKREAQAGTRALLEEAP